MKRGRTRQEAFAFAGHEWTTFTVESRERLLQRAGGSKNMVRWRWTQLPPSVQSKLAEPLMGKGKR